MLSLASFWVYLVLFEALNIDESQLWDDIMLFYAFSPFFCWFYPLGLDIGMKTYIVMSALIACYLVTVTFYDVTVKEGQRLDWDDM